MVEGAGVLEDRATRAYLLRMIGEAGLELIEKIPDEGEFSDEELAENTGVNLNTVRHTLYTLYGKRLAEYRRIKNSETGWLTYLWKLRLDMIEDTMYEEIENVLEKLEAREKYEEENDFYICKNCGIMYTFNQALDRNFECSCDEKMDHFDNELLLTALKRRVAQINRMMGRA